MRLSPNNDARVLPSHDTFRPTGIRFQVANIESKNWIERKNILAKKRYRLKWASKAKHFATLFEWEMLSSSIYSSSEHCRFISQDEVMQKLSERYETLEVPLERILQS